MAEPEKNAQADDDLTGDVTEEPEGGPVVPVEEWVQHPVSDSADYLDRPAPQYGAGLDGEDKDAYDAAVSEREKRLSGHQGRRQRGSQSQRPTV